MDLKEFRKDYDSGVVISKLSYGKLLAHTEQMAITLDEVSQKLEAFRRVENIATPECKNCADTGSLSKSLTGYYDCHYCQRSDENARVIEWYAATMLGNNSEADVLNIYYHGKNVGAERIAALEAEKEKLRGQLIPEGWKVVPAEPTDEMVIAFAEAWYTKLRCFDDPEMNDAYAAMLAVVPGAPASLPAQPASDDARDTARLDYVAESECIIDSGQNINGKFAYWLVWPNLGEHQIGMFDSPRAAIDAAMQASAATGEDGRA